MTHIEFSRNYISVNNVVLACGRTVHIRYDGVYENGLRIIEYRVPPIDTLHVGACGVSINGILLIDGAGRSAMPRDGDEIRRYRFENGQVVCEYRNGLFNILGNVCHFKFDRATHHVSVSNDSIFVDGIEIDLSIGFYVNQPVVLPVVPKSRSQAHVMLSKLNWQSLPSDSESLTCQICEMNLRDVVLLDCGHTNSCVVCARRIAADADANGRDFCCTICNAVVVDVCQMIS